jgi:hypothetical protein
MDELNLEALLPELDSLLGWVSFLVRILVMAGPLCMLGLGLYYFLAPPPEANHSAGYRFRYGMARVGSWQFMQKLAGIVYSITGLLLTVIMAFLCARFKYLAPMDMVMTAGKMILWEVGALIVATLGINVTVMILFDHKGKRRKK